MIVCGSDGDGVIAKGERTVMGADVHQPNAWLDDHLFRLVQLVWIDRISRRSFVDPSLTSCFEFSSSTRLALDPSASSE